MFLRGVRGAITVDKNEKVEIIKETKHLLSMMLDKNDLDVDAIASIFFSATKDLDMAFPAAAARELNLLATPLLCLNEIDVFGGLLRCVRILIHVNTDKAQKDMYHIYLKDAVQLRPDLAM